MNPFIAWAVSWQGTAALMVCALVLGIILGELDGKPRGRRAEAEDIEREEAMARRTHPVYRQPASDQFAAIREAGRRAWAIQQERAALPGPYRSGTEDEAVASDDPTVSAWTADMAASMDRWLAEHVYGVPYSADELWSGQ